MTKRVTEDFTKVAVSIEAKRNDEPAPTTTPAPAVVAPIVETTVVAPAPVSVATVSDANTVELIALYDYTASEDNEISFSEGEKVILLEKDESGWWKYVSFLDCITFLFTHPGAGMRAAKLAFSHPTLSRRLVRAAPVRSLMRAPRWKSTRTTGALLCAVVSLTRCSALYDYEAEDETELTIKEGEVLRVLTETDGWYFGTNKQGHEGNFPSNFVEPC